MPEIWLFSDERLENPLLQVAAHLPPGSGIILRHDESPRGARWRLARRLMRLARARGLVVLIVDDPAMAKAWGMDGVHLRQHMAHRAEQARALGLVISMPVHDRGQARSARRAGADLAFVSPIYGTRSHARAGGLGVGAWLRLARDAGAMRVAALGGMDAVRARALRKRTSGLRHGIAWAAIDALDQAYGRRRNRRRAGKKRAGKAPERV